MLLLRIIKEKWLKNGGGVLLMISTIIALIMLLVVAPLLLVVVHKQNSKGAGPTTRAATAEAIITAAPTTTTLSLVPGDLPGYTGWYRPSTTLSQYYEIVHVDDPSTIVTSFGRKNWTLTVKCTHPKYCRQGGNDGDDNDDSRSHFYVRAYGPSILPGVVTENTDDDGQTTTYTVSIMPFDAGVYQVEVVLAFSKLPPFSKLPFTQQREYGYEGYLLPGFPMQVEFPSLSSISSRNQRRQRRNSEQQDESVAAPPRSSRPNKRRRRRCTIPDLLETSRNGALERGRWLITERITAQPYYKNMMLDHNNNNTTNTNNNAVITGYQHGTNSIGFHADYFYNDCSLISPPPPSPTIKRGGGGGHDGSNNELIKALLRLLDDNLSYGTTPVGSGTNGKDNRTRRSRRTALPHQGPIRVLFIGDSTMRIQRNAFDLLFGGDGYGGNSIIDTEHIDTSGGLLPTLPVIQRRLEELKNETANNYFVMFNSGLHDINRLCVHKSINNNHTYIDITQPGFSCFEEYARALEKFADLVMAFPSLLTVWQTTTAGWPKWGVWGAAWSPSTLQVSALSPNSVLELNNNIAWDILEKRQVPIMDAYWLSYSRPDNREINHVNELSRHLVHPGLEVINVLNRKWAMMILETIQNSVTKTTKKKKTKDRKRYTRLSKS